MTNNIEHFDASKLLPLREALIDVHAQLLAAERVKYEKQHGAFKSSADYFRLVVGDPAFQWLRTLSTLIVSIDELMENKGPVVADQITSLFGYLKSILTPNPEGNEFEKKYYQALQDHPEVVVAHGRLIKEITNLQQ